MDEQLTSNWTPCVNVVLQRSGCQEGLQGISHPPVAIAIVLGSMLPKSVGSYVVHAAPVSESSELLHTRETMLTAPVEASKGLTLKIVSRMCQQFVEELLLFRYFLNASPTQYLKKLLAKTANRFTLNFSGTNEYQSIRSLSVGFVPFFAS